MVNKTFDFISGSHPILISMPHNGSLIPENIQSVMTDEALESKDTDWYLDKLYRFAIEQGCYLINPSYSRYVIDLNRPSDNQNLYPGQDTTELCPTTQFNHHPIYQNGKEPNQSEIETRIEKYWQPYHRQIDLTLKTITEKYGSALLFEAHSIKSVVPRFFDGMLADLNFGNNDGLSCSEQLIEQLERWQPTGVSKVINGRFKGGYITRAYGCPAKNIHSIQLELSQATYMNEEALSFDAEKSIKIKPVLNEMFDIFNHFINETCNLAINNVQEI